MGAISGLSLAALAGGDLLVEFRRPVSRNTQRLPVIVSEMLGQHHNLPDMVSVVRHLPVDGLHDRMRFPADRHRAPEVGIRQRIERMEDAIPAILPGFHQRRARGRRVHELGVAIPIRLLAIGSKEIGPPRSHIAGHMLYYRRNGIHFAVERGVELLVGHLIHGALREFLVIAEQIERILEVGGREFQSHALIITAETNHTLAIICSSMRARTTPAAGAPRRAACALMALLAVLLVWSWTAARIHYAFAGNWTAVFCTGTIFTVPPDLADGTYRVDGSGYDGQFYRYLAHDPFLSRGYSRYVDSPQLRFRRVLVPLASWLLALGQDRWIDRAYIAVELLFLGLGVYCCARLMVRRHRPAFWGLLFLGVPATMASFDRMLVDGPLVALFAGFLLYCEEERWTRVWLLAMLAGLTRDTGLLLAAALLTDRLWHRDWRRAAWFASSIIPAILWYGYLAAHFPPDGPVPILELPVWGLVRRLLWFRPYPDAGMQLLLRVTDVLAVLGLVGTIVVALHWLQARGFGPVTLCVGLFAALGLVLGAPAHMRDAFGFARPVSPLLLWVMLEAVSRKAWTALAPPLLVSLSVSLVFAKPGMAIAKGLLGR